MTAPKVTTGRPRKCQGITGRLFGHQFIKVKGGNIYSGPYCYRCGMPRGGWNGE